MITDERLKELIEHTEKLKHIKLDKGIAIHHPYQEYNAALKELLSLREQMEVVKGTKIFIDELQEQKRRLIEDAEWLHRSMCAYLDYCECGIGHKCYDPVGANINHESLMKELDA